MRGLWLILLTVAHVAPPLLADPSIVWSGEQNIAMGPYGLGEPSYAEWLLDFNNDGTSDLRFSFATEAFLVSPFDNNQTIVTLGGITDASAVLLPDAAINGSIASPQAWNGDDQELVHWFGLLPDDAVCDGPWCGIENQYLGVAFEINGQTHYGWVGISASDELPYGTIHSWAYETNPEQGINAGVVPEPSSIALFAAGMVALGLKSFRRRKLHHYPHLRRQPREPDSER